MVTSAPVSTLRAASVASILHVGDLLEPERARHVDGRFDEMFWADRSDAHILHAKHAGERQRCAPVIVPATPSGARSTSALIVWMTSRSASTAIKRCDADRRRRVAPAIAGGDDREAGEHGEGGENVGGEVESVGFKRRAMRLPADLLERPRAPGVDDDLDQKHADRDDADRRRRLRRS